MSRDRQAAAKDKEFVDALARGLAVIECFDEAHPQLSLSEVARRANLTPATARRNLHTLATLGYLRKVENQFLLSARVLALGSGYLRAAHVDDALMPELRRIVGLFGDAASVAVLTGDDVLYVAHVSEQRGVRPMARIGVTYPAHATSLGRVLLAGLPPDALDRYLAAAKLDKLTGATCTDRAQLRRLITTARELGYATAVDQLAYGVTSLAVPIHGLHGEVVAAVNSSGYTGRLSIENLVEQRLDELRTASRRIAQMLQRYPALYHSFPTGRAAAAEPPRRVLARPAGRRQS
ncbi:MAG: helix-turn-helix domain-containing protein [Alphaproteobacteria bacterium]|nr:helix-turn-helix domain-containing protein [Alphaproteobacteria bacterium]